MVDCDKCYGKGLDPADYSKRCEFCKGSGKKVAADDKPKAEPSKK